MVKTGPELFALSRESREPKILRVSSLQVFNCLGALQRSMIGANLHHRLTTLHFKESHVWCRTMDRTSKVGGLTPTPLGKPIGNPSGKSNTTSASPSANDFQHDVPPTTHLRTSPQFSRRSNQSEKAASQMPSSPTSKIEHKDHCSPSTLSKP